MPRLFILMLFVMLGSSNLGKASTAESSLDYFPREQTRHIREVLVGKWQGERVDTNSKTVWLVTRMDNGEYRIDFKVTGSDGKSESWSEVGVWGVRKPVYFTAMRGWIRNGKFAPADTRNPAFYDAYRIVSADVDQFVYQSYTSGKVYTVKKVLD